MPVLVVFVLALAPGLFWLWVVYRRDRFRPEPRALVVRTFLWGMAAVVPVAVLEAAVLLLLVPDALGVLMSSRAPLATAVTFALVVGVVEEAGKFLVVRRTVYGSPYFDEPTDGLVYAAAAALGFASLENFVYLLSFGWQAILVRGAVSTVAHVIFAGLWGYPLARHRVLGSSAFWVWLGLGAAIAAHGLFDFLILAEGGYWPLVIPLFAACGAAFVLMFRHGRRHSPFRDMVAYLEVECPACGQRVPGLAGYCPHCGAAISAGRGQAGYCSKCGAGVPARAAYCPACGSRLVRQAGRGPG